jgi:hypothetical protein
LKLCLLYPCREDNEILGSYMLIHGVRREDFGQYTCQISNTWFQSVDTSVWLREIGKEKFSNNELEMMGRQAFLSYFKEGILQLPRRIEESHKERPQSGSPGFCPRLPGTFKI